jgi:lipopolysaccharide export system protein LptA
MKMIKYFLLTAILLQLTAFSEELKIKANIFNADEQKGISIFSGDVRIKKHNDELNASEVTIYTDKKNQPTKFVAIGSVSFKIATKKGAKYEGKAGRVVYIPKDQQYHFYEDVHLKQIDEKKEIIGDEVTLAVQSGKAFAKGVKSGPVIMIFDIKDEKE